MMNGKCSFCGKDLEVSKKTQAKSGNYFCNYECMSNAYGDDIPEGEDFLKVC